MNKSVGAGDNATKHRKTSRVRFLGDVLDGEKQGRREFLRMLAARGASIPAGYFMIGNTIGDRPIPAARAAPVQTGAQQKANCALRLSPTHSRSFAILPTRTWS